MKIQQVTHTLADIPTLLVAARDGDKVSGEITTFSHRVSSAIINHDEIILEDGTPVRLLDKSSKLYSYDLVLISCRFEANISELGDSWEASWYE